jgi:hypothetical protein
MTEKIVRCPSCEGYGWTEDEFSGENESCAWCDGAGYVYQGADGVQRPIPNTDYETVATELERLEKQRLHEMGYTGEAKPPWEQNIRNGTVGGLHPSEREDS